MLQELVKFFINPVLQIFLVIMIFIFQKRPGKFFTGFVLYFYFVSIPLTGIVFHHLWKLDDSFKEEKNYDYAVVLTGGVDPKWFPKEKGSKNVTIDLKESYIFNAQAERFIKAIELVKSGKVEKIFYGNYVRTSNKGTVNTAIIVERFAIQNGVNEDQFIRYGENINNTRDEAKNLARHFQNNSNKNILLITSESHMRRAVALFEKQEFQLEFYSVQKRIPLFRDLLILKNYIPSIRGLRNTKNSYYELLGFLGYYFIGEI